MEESPSDSGLSDGTKTTHHDDMNELIIKNPAVIDLSKPLSKEEMLAIMQIIRELWRKQFDCEIPEVTLPTPSFQPTASKSNLSTKSKTQFHSTPALNKLSAELSDIKDKLKRFASERQQTEPVNNAPKTSGSSFSGSSLQRSNDRALFVSRLESENSHDDEDPVFVSWGKPMTVSH